MDPLIILTDYTKALSYIPPIEKPLSSITKIAQEILSTIKAQKIK